MVSLNPLFWKCLGKRYCHKTFICHSPALPDNDAHLHKRHPHLSQLAMGSHRCLEWSAHNPSQGHRCTCHLQLEWSPTQWGISGSSHSRQHRSPVRRDTHSGHRLWERSPSRRGTPGLWWRGGGIMIRHHQLYANWFSIIALVISQSHSYL